MKGSYLVKSSKAVWRGRGVTVGRIQLCWRAIDGNRSTRVSPSLIWPRMTEMGCGLDHLDMLMKMARDRILKSSNPWRPSVDSIMEILEFRTKEVFCLRNARADAEPIPLVVDISLRNTPFPEPR